MGGVGTMLGIPPAAAPAWVELVTALDRLADRGQTPVCTRRPDDWASDASARVRREAAEACQHCPVMGLCGDYADAAGEQSHVWGGVDRTTAPRRQGAAA